MFAHIRKYRRMKICKQCHKILNWRRLSIEQDLEMKSEDLHHIDREASHYDLSLAAASFCSMFDCCLPACSPCGSKKKRDPDRQEKAKPTIFICADKHSYVVSMAPLPLTWDTIGQPPMLDFTSGQKPQNVPRTPRPLCLTLWASQGKRTALHNARIVLINHFYKKWRIHTENISENHVFDDRWVSGQAANPQNRKAPREVLCRFTTFAIHLQPIYKSLIHVQSVAQRCRPTALTQNTHLRSTNPCFHPSPYFHPSPMPA